MQNKTEKFFSYADVLRETKDQIIQQVGYVNSTDNLDSHLFSLTYSQATLQLFIQIAKSQQRNIYTSDDVKELEALIDTINNKINNRKDI